MVGRLIDWRMAAGGAWLVGRCWLDGSKRSNPSNRRRAAMFACFSLDLLLVIASRTPEKFTVGPLFC